MFSLSFRLISAYLGYIIPCFTIDIKNRNVYFQAQYTTRSCFDRFFFAYCTAIFKG